MVFVKCRTQWRSEEGKISVISQNASNSSLFWDPSKEEQRAKRVIAIFFLLLLIFGKKGQILSSHLRLLVCLYRVEVQSIERINNQS
ncbi:hypothetical protein CH361_17520 [Leptospira brenneri]|nr:hypothetical protein CH361_17520 [Leptospira brenneri]